LAAVVEDRGTAMQVDQEAVEVAAAQHQTELDQIITLAQTIVVIKIWAVEELPDKVFLEEAALDLIVRAKIVTKQGVVAEQVVLDTVLKMIKDRD
jgi:hypothetical protein